MDWYKNLMWLKNQKQNQPEICDELQAMVAESYGAYVRRCTRNSTDINFTGYIAFPGSPFLDSEQPRAIVSGTDSSHLHKVRLEEGENWNGSFYEIAPTLTIESKWCGTQTVSLTGFQTTVDNSRNLVEVAQMISDRKSVDQILRKTKSYPEEGNEDCLPKRTSFGTV